VPINHRLRFDNHQGRGQFCQFAAKNAQNRSEAVSFGRFTERSENVELVA
jgi:hypothetical protein